MRCAIYLRISLDHTGEGLAVARQQEDCRKIANERGWEVVAVYSDTMSALKHRPAYQELVQSYENGDFEAVICWDLDRLTRTPRELEDWIDRNAVVVTANGEADLSTDAGRLFARIKASVARAEIERKGARQRRASLQRAQRGKPPLGPRLTGYTVQGETIPEEAEIVRRIYALFVAGESLRSIARQLDVPTRHGGKWSPTSVRHILVNPRYVGRAIYNGEPIGTAIWEPLIDEETWAVVQSKLSDPRRKHGHGTDRKHLGSGLYLCDCGRPVRGFSNQSYRCANGCYSRTRKHIDDLVVRVITERLKTVTLAPNEATKPYVDEADKLRKRLSMIGSDYDAGLIDGARYKIATTKVQTQLDDLERKIAAATGLNLGVNPSEAFASASLMRKRAVIDLLCTVTILRGKVGSHSFYPESVVIEWKQ